MCAYAHQQAGLTIMPDKLSFVKSNLKFHFNILCKQPASDTINGFLSSPTHFLPEAAAIFSHIGHFPILLVELLRLVSIVSKSILL